MFCKSYDALTVVDASKEYTFVQKQLYISWHEWKLQNHFYGSLSFSYFFCKIKRFAWRNTSKRNVEKITIFTTAKSRSIILLLLYYYTAKDRKFSWRQWKPGLHFYSPYAYIFAIQNINISKHSGEGGSQEPLYKLIQFCIQFKTLITKFITIILIDVKNYYAANK